MKDELNEKFAGPPHYCIVTFDKKYMKIFHFFLQNVYTHFSRVLYY
jgi:hypothetical protein